MAGDAGRIRCALLLRRICVYVHILYDYHIIPSQPRHDKKDPHLVDHGFSILLTVIGILGFSFSGSFYMLIVFAVPYGLGAGAIDAAVNHYVANNYSGRIKNFLHCFYGVGAIISPNIMAYALSRATWHEGYRWTAYIQTGIWLMPYYLLLFAVMNLVLLELAYKAIRKDRMLNEGFSI